MRNLLDRSLLRFLAAGSATVGVDAVTYWILLNLGVPIDPAKAVGFVTGMVFAFVVNRDWTFRGERRGMRQLAEFLALYGGGLLVNTGANRLVIEIIGDQSLDLSIAWFIATGLSASWNYIGMRLVVFR